MTGRFTTPSTVLKLGRYFISVFQRSLISRSIVCNDMVFAWTNCLSRNITESLYISVSSSRSAWYAAVPIWSCAFCSGNRCITIDVSWLISYKSGSSSMTGSFRSGCRIRTSAGTLARNFIKSTSLTLRQLPIWTKQPVSFFFQFLKSCPWYLLIQHRRYTPLFISRLRLISGSAASRIITSAKALQKTACRILLAGYWIFIWRSAIICSAPV